MLPCALLSVGNVLSVQHLEMYILCCEQDAIDLFAGIICTKSILSVCVQFFVSSTDVYSFVL